MTGPWRRNFDVRQILPACEQFCRVKNGNLAIEFGGSVAARCNRRILAMTALKRFPHKVATNAKSSVSAYVKHPHQRKSKVNFTGSKSHLARWLLVYSATRDGFSFLDPSRFMDDGFASVKRGQQAC